MNVVSFDDTTLDRMERAVEKVKDRLKRATEALASAGVPYAIVGGNAVAAWVAQTDEAAVRNTRDVDILLNRSDLEAAKKAMEAAGFVYRHVKSIDMFLDGEGAKARDAVHVIFAGEKVRSEDPVSTPTLDEVEVDAAFRVISLEALVRMKLVSYRDKDRTHLRDMIEVGMIDDSWPSRFQPELGARLQALLDDPEG